MVFWDGFKATNITLQDDWTEFIEHDILGEIGKIILYFYKMAEGLSQKQTASKSAKSSKSIKIHQKTPNPLISINISWDRYRSLGLWLDLRDIMVFMQIFLLAVGGLLGIGLILIVSNAIKLSVYSRRHEVELMMMMGARIQFVKGPFLLEGVLQALAGCVFSILIVGIFFYYRPGA